jgi:hypothetical protein
VHVNCPLLHQFQQLIGGNNRAEFAFRVSNGDSAEMCTIGMGFLGSAAVGLLEGSLVEASDSQKTVVNTAALLKEQPIGLAKLSFCQPPT